MRPYHLSHKMWVGREGPRAKTSENPRARSKTAAARAAPPPRPPEGEGRGDEGETGLSETVWLLGGLLVIGIAEMRPRLVRQDSRPGGLVNLIGRMAKARAIQVPSAATAQYKQ